ncbi:MlaE family ABC transporter permease [Paludisphaera mucosa]|uniref:ABC transporter permease n=1 Tax=Paludisphaera mucosa TaxID=3030827 RepID=A0ABT6FH64_9BACT|nr:ABC transporter permease [Paludisphaera mucosa]MDG3006912.1 ABC transporter permease [Paludisphaera mucosa]
MKTLILGSLARAGRFPAFAARTLLAVPPALLRRGGEVARLFEQVAVRSLPIVAGAGLSVGLVTWFQTHRLLAAHGAEAALPSFLAVAVVVELGPLLAGVLAAGRVGAGLAAEMGVMSLNEEIDARIVLGADPIAGLVAPRVIACILAVPLLTVLVDASALVGALAAEGMAGNLSPQLFWRQSLVFLRLSDVIPATLKTAVFGLMVGLVGCWVGLESERSAEAVGRAATRGVVASTLAVFAANVALVPFIPWATGLMGLAGL